MGDFPPHKSRKRGTTPLFSPAKCAGKAQQKGLLFAVEFPVVLDELPQAAVGNDVQEELGEVVGLSGHDVFSF